MRRLSFFLAIFLALPFGSALWAQSRYLVQADLSLSVWDSTDLWINGRKLVSQDPTLSASRGYVTIHLQGDALCAFQKDDLLALEYENGIEFHSETEQFDQVGIAYVLDLKFSDGQRTVLTSDEEGQHRVFTTDNRPGTDPSGWKDMGFADSAWEAARLVPPSSGITKILHDPRSGKVVRYLHAFDFGSLRAHHGERRLYRRRFALDIVPAPPCPQPRTPPTATPRPRPTSTSTFTPVPPTRPTATAVFTATPRPRPTRTPTPLPVIRPKPTATAVPKRRKPTAVPTDTPEPLLTSTPTPIRRVKWVPTSTPRPKATSTFTPMPMVAASMPETIVFVNPPVNIHVNFADGQGQYRLAVLDAKGGTLSVLYDKRVSFDREAWVTWDGTDMKGRLMPRGTYDALFTKDGKLLKRIELEWIEAGEER